MKASDTYYCNEDKCDDFTALLCNTIESESVHEVHAIIYNGRDRTARKLADWWDNHQQHDAEREAREATEAKDKQEREEVLNSLTSYQRAVLFPGE